MTLTINIWDRSAIVVVRWLNNMKVIPVAYNHIHLELDNGEILDINDGTSTPNSNNLMIQLSRPSDRYMIVYRGNDEAIEIRMVHK